MKFHLNQLSTTSNLANGDWYIMAFMGGGEKKGDDLEVNTETTINVIEKGKELLLRVLSQLLGAASLSKEIS